VADRLRVLLVLGPSTGGIGIHVRTLGEQLVQRGHDVSICAPAATQATFDWTGTRARFIPAAVAAGASAPGLGAWRALRRAGLAHDVVHAHGIRASAAAALTRAPALVATWHNAPLGGRGRRDTHALLERLAARGAAVTLGASEDLVDRARRAGGRDVRFAPVVAPPLPAATRPAAQVRDELGIGDRPLLLAVARLAAQKRLDLLVAATRGWSDRPDRPVVLVAGDGDAAVAAALRSQAERLHSPLRLLGHRDDVADLLTAADVAVLTSEWEARPLVLQEAMRAGVPVVATAVGGVPGLVGTAGALVPAGAVEDLRAALTRLVDDPEERSRLRTAGLERAAAWPGVEQMVDELENIYFDLRSRSRSGSG
jgi:glycosyltransferase involved in cell wall biosynthesis